MKTVYPNNEIAHLWAHQTQPSARNAKSSFYFEGETIYSYGSHFPIARWVTNSTGERIILFTTRSYSPTTSGHVSRVRSAIPAGVRIFYVSHPDYEPIDILERESKPEIRALLEKAADANKRNRPKYLSDAMHVREGALELIAFFGLDVSLPEIPAEEHVVQMIDALREREEHEQKERERKAERQYDLDRQKAMRKFRAGDNRAYVRYKDGSVALRIDGNEVVTSLGARVPMEHARRGLVFVRKVRNSGQEYVRNGHTFHLGHYVIDRIEADGTLHAGCHVIKYAEIERIAPSLEAVLNVA